MVAQCISVILTQPIESLSINTTVEAKSGNISQISKSKQYSPDCETCTPVLVQWPEKTLAKVYVDGDLQQISRFLNAKLVDSVMEEIKDYLTTHM